MKEEGRYTAQRSLPEIGMLGQERIQSARILVVGAGGLGCPVISYLAAAGVGTLGIVDGDTVGLSNLPRQLLFNEGDLGQKKAVVAANKLTLLHPDTKTYVFPERLTEHNATAIAGPYDLVMDCTDDVSSRYLINDACVHLGLPFVYAGIHRFEGQLAVLNYRGGPTYRCLYPEPEQLPLMQNCSDVGVIGPLAGLMGCWQASEAIKIIVNSKDVLDKLLVISLLANQLSKIFIPVRKKRTGMKNAFQEGSSLSIGVSQLIGKLQKERLSMQLADVREKHETPAVPELEEITLPISQWKSCLSLVDSTKDLILYCQTGKRSMQMAKALRVKLNRTNIYSLTGGVSKWVKALQEKKHG
jgi:molybdopterin/thiamine biosynthesis adenylyltransferase/rhodanese-related sulfurtransferase